MTTKVQKWGNSQGLRLSKGLLEDAQLSVGDEVNVVVRDGAIVIRPIRRVRGRYSLPDLVARIPKGHRTREINWGPAVGKESW
jgi:antitoxin MazE